MKGGSMGEISMLVKEGEQLVKEGKIKKARIGKYRFYDEVGDNKEEAERKVKSWNKSRSPGEKSYYKIHYKLFEN